MAKAANGGFVSFYRSNDRLEAIYLLNEDADSYQQHYKAGGLDVYEFVASKAIQAAVDIYRKAPKNAKVSVVDFENLSAALTGEAKVKPAAVAPAAVAAPAKRGPKPGGKRAAKAAPAKGAAKKTAGGAKRGKRPSISDAAMADFAAMLKKGASKQEIEKMLKGKHGLKYSPASYYNWKVRAEGG